MVLASGGSTAGCITTAVSVGGAGGGGAGSATGLSQAVKRVKRLTRAGVRIGFIKAV
jgi:hypothetical protein